MMTRLYRGTTALACAVAITTQAKEVPDSTDTQTLEEVIVTGNSARGRVADGHFGSETLELSKLCRTPQLFGETDIIKSITLLPGVHNEAEGAGGFEVRGGNAYQNLVTMDGMTICNPSHLMGIFSTFNDDATGSATLHKGPIPSRFGGASSSVLETFMRPGDMHTAHFSGTIGILNAKVSAEIPVIKDRLSVAVAARRSYVDLFLKLIPEYKSTVMNFFDVNAKIRYKADVANLVDVSFFASRDHLAVADLMSLRWGNLAGSVNWSNTTGDSWHFTTTAAMSNYTTDMGMDIMDSSQELTEYIRSFSLNEQATYELNENHRLELGARTELLRVKSADMIVNDSHQREIRSGWVNALWLGYEGRVSRRLSITAGVRLECFCTLSAAAFHAFEALNEDTPDFSAHTYISPEPRGSLKFYIDDYHNLRAGASVTSQNIHGIRSTSSTFPFDRYALTSAQVRTERTVQYSAGYAGMTPEGGWDWSAEGYYKSMNHVYDYKDGMSMFSRINLESIILGGRGRSYGLELMLRKNSGRLTGWVAYTLSKTETRIDGINDGAWYRASNDCRSHLAVAGIFQLNEKWNLSATWTFSSGKPLTAPDGKYEIAGTTCYYYSGRNKYITPASHRLDISATYTRKGRKNTSVWAFGVYNAYNHYSPFVIYFEDDPSKPSGTRAVQQSLFGIIPSVSYTIKF